ncbi:hypothetical protein [Leuconostoc pseudomesenteroides]|uniref:hypothetical protein n=1 Tax=Leuconostoc pseudomesenteroides TaxID=33968 RepID=UPI0032DEA837
MIDKNMQVSHLKDVNSDVQVQLEKVQAITDYLRRINNNQYAMNKDFFKSDFLQEEIGNAETAVSILDEFIDTAVNLLKSVEVGE